MGQINQGSWCQETYETGDKAIRFRANHLRRRGYKVVVCSLGQQVTQYGLVQCTMIDIRPGTHKDTLDIGVFATHSAL